MNPQVFAPGDARCGECGSLTECRIVGMQRTPRCYACVPLGNTPAIRKRGVLFPLRRKRRARR